MAYKQQHQYTYRDSLEKGDPEKVIKGEYFDDEFAAIEASFGSIPGAGGGDISPDTPGYEDVVFQDRTADQQVISKFTFAVAGQEPLTVENTGIWAGANYVKYVSADTTWKIFPALDVEGDLSVTGDTHLEGALEVDGDAQLNADLNVSGELDVTGGITAGGDLNLSGNIIIDGGSIVDPDGNPAGSLWTDNLDGTITHGPVTIDDNAHNLIIENDGGMSDSSSITFDNSGGSGNADWHVGSTLQGAQFYIDFDGSKKVLTFNANTEAAVFSGNIEKIGNAAAIFGTFGNDMVVGTSDCTAVMPMTNGQADLGGVSNNFKDAYIVGEVNAGSFVKSGGTSSELLCADGSVVDKGAVGGNTDLSDYYTKTEADGKYSLLTHNHDGVYAKVGDSYTKTESDNKYETKGGGGAGGLPDGGYTYGWNITAVDFIATSDERAKDNITTAPVGLIDSLKGREWDWKESGEKGSGVVAQELEEVLPHLVHTDDEGMKSVAYNGLIAYLIEEVKALRAEVEVLKS